MELFEILFILFFILIPIINGISKSRKRGEESEDIQLPGEARPGRREQSRQPDWSEPGEGPAEPAEAAEAAEAADMVPDDLWEILTGERRQRDTVPAPAEPTPEPPEPEMEPVGTSEEWTHEPPWQAEEAPPERERFEPAPWLEERSDDWRDDLPMAPEPEPQVERYAPETRAARRLRIATQDALVAPRARNVSPLVQALRSPDGLRQAVVLREILGPPKGLQR